MKRHLVSVSSGLVAGVILAALLLRPRHSIPPGPELARPERLPPTARAAVRAKMGRHAERLSALVSRAVVLDYDGVARTAGEIFDEPLLAQPAAGDAVAGLLPERFFIHQAALRAEARRVVEAATRRDAASLGSACGALTTTCIACHDVYLHGATP